MCPEHRQPDRPGTAPVSGRLTLARTLLLQEIMKLFALSLLALATTSGAAVAAAPAWKSANPSPAALEGDCQEAPTEDPALNAALRALVFQGAGQPAGEPQAFSGVRFSGLATVQEPALWEVLGGRPAGVDAERAALLIRRLVGLGLFASVTPVVELGREKEGPVLVLQVKEHLTIRRVVFEGLSELSPEGLLESLLSAPSRQEVERRRVKQNARPGVAGDSRPRCPDPLPPRDWLARSEDQVVFPGVAFGGTDAALDRLVGYVFDRGYEMATVAADLAGDGTLTVKLNEGKIARIDLKGVEPRIEGEVRQLLGLTPGQPYLRDDVETSVERIRGRFPFLRASRDNRPTRRRPRMVLEQESEAGRRWRTVDQPASDERRWWTVDGQTLTLHLRSIRFNNSASASELIRHTQVTSFAPGLENRTWVWDAADRVHLRVDAGANVNTQRATAPLPDPSGELDRWRFDWSAGGALEIPDAHIAELGVKGYARVDTSDRWRIDRVDSYLYSLVFNRPDSEYFRRQGLTAFLTTHLAQHLTAGMEYRRDDYRSLRPANDVFTFFNRDEPPAANPPISDGQMASLLFRLEASTLATPSHRVGTMRRDPERSIVEVEPGRTFFTTLRTVNTLEVADQGLGGDFDFVRLVSDSAGVLRMGDSQMVKVRFRAAGKLGGTLPLQKDEAQGGWTDLRGYGFKEFRNGDFSLLGTVEYGVGPLSLFVDIGSLRQADAWSSARTGVGGALNLPEDVHLDVAWRTDDQAELSPEVRLLFQRTF